MARTIVIYGSTAWDVPWLTEHHLAHALGAEHRVLFVEAPRTPAEPLRRNLGLQAGRELTALFCGRLRNSGRIHVLRTLVLPPASNRLARWLSRPLFSIQVRRALATLGLQADLVVSARDVVGAPGAGDAVVVALVKDWVQSGAHLVGRTGENLRRDELATWQRANLVLAVSTRLRDRLAEEGVHSTVLRHAYDASRTPPVASRTPPVARLSRPILGCVGRIDARWGYDALEELADLYSHGSVVLVGPVSRLAPRARLDRLISLGNVHRFDPVPGDELPAWLEQFDCCLIPYVHDDWQQYASPLKVWDYLHAGRPIVATGAPALGDFPEGLVHYAEDVGRLPELVARALDEPAGSSSARRAYALANTWDDRVAQLLALVSETGPRGSAVILAPARASDG